MIQPLGLIASLLLALQVPLVEAPLSLDQAVNAALAAHPQIQASRSAVEVAAARIREQSAGYLPRVQVSESAVRGNNPVFVFGSLLEQGRFGAANFAISSLNQPAAVTNLRTTLSATASILDGSRTSARVEQARAGKEQVEDRVRLLEQSIRFETIRSFYGVLVSRAALDVAEQAVRSAEADEKRTRDRLAAGVVVDADVLSAQLRSAEVRQQRIRAQAGVANAEAAFNILVGQPVETASRITGSLEDKVFTIEDTGTVLRRALEQRPEIQASTSALRSHDSSIREAKADFLPSANAFGNFSVSGKNPVSGSSDYTVGASVSFDIFNAARGSRVGAARAARAEAAAERDQVTNQVKLEVVRAVQAFRVAQQQLDVAKSSVLQATEARRIIQDRYDEGLTTTTELLRAQTELVRTQMELLAARQDYVVGYAALLLATGELNDVRLLS